MSFCHPSQMRPCAWTDLVVLSVASPLIAAGIQSVCIFYSHFRIYQAIIGGAYFHTVDDPGFATLVSILWGCGIFGVPTFFVLLPFRRRSLYCWLVWVGSIAIWTWLLYNIGRSAVIK